MGSKATLPSNVEVKSIDYENISTITEALRGQDALVITLGGFAPPDTQVKLINAASEAGVKWILPNEWGIDTANADLCKDLFVMEGQPKTRALLESIPSLSFTSIITGFWYEWSLAIVPAYGFDFAKKSVTFFDDGNTVTSMSTWPQVGRAVASLFSLPLEDNNAFGPSLSDFKNKIIYVNSFNVSQRDMFDSVLRVTNTKNSDWKITNEHSNERYADGVKGMKEGNRVGFAKMLYTRVFYPDGSGLLKKHGFANEALGLPVEDLDEATKRAYERSKTVENWVDQDGESRHVDLAH